MATVRDVRHMAAASHPVRVPDLAAVSAVLVRAGAVVRTDSAKAIDPVRAVAAVVQVRARARDRDRGVGLVPVVVAGADAD